jgi:hypothetical protein
MRTTDQNGLGICHLEQLHKMLKARLPGHPDLSRIQLAIAEKSTRDKGQAVKKAVRWGGPTNVGGTYLDAGSSCGAFNLIKGQGICPAKSDRFEQLTKQNPSNQEKIIETLSLYFDQRQNNPFTPGFGVPGLDAVRPALDRALLACGPSMMQLYSLRKSMDSYLAQNKSFLGFTNVLLTSRQSTLKESDFAMKTIDFIGGTSYEAHLTKVLTNNPDFIFTGAGAEEVKKQIRSLASSMRTNETCVTKKAQENLSPFCLSPLGDTTKQMLGLSELGLSIQEILRLLKGSWDRDTYFQEAFACNGFKVPIPSSIVCRDTDLVNMAAASKTQQEYHEKASAKIDAYLAKGTPVGISVCTRFFRNPASKLVSAGSKDYKCGDKKDPNYKNGEGSHAVTIIASRCRNGRPEYLVQNSWGSGCFYSDSFECTKKGGFWAPASVVLNNTRRFSALE